MSVIYDTVLNEINEFKATIQEAASMAKYYADSYISYCSLTMRDADLLKVRISDKVKETVNEDFWEDIPTANTNSSGGIVE